MAVSSRKPLVPQGTNGRVLKEAISSSQPLVPQGTNGRVLKEEAGGCSLDGGDRPVLVCLGRGDGGHDGRREDELREAVVRVAAEVDAAVPQVELADTPRTEDRPHVLQRSLLLLKWKRKKFILKNFYNLNFFKIFKIQKFQSKPINNSGVECS